MTLPKCWSALLKYGFVAVYLMTLPRWWFTAVHFTTLPKSLFFAFNPLTHYNSFIFEDPILKTSGLDKQLLNIDVLVVHTVFCFLKSSFSTPASPSVSHQPVSALHSLHVDICVASRTPQQEHFPRRSGNSSERQRPRLCSRADVTSEVKGRSEKLFFFF